MVPFTPLVEIPSLPDPVGQEQRPPRPGISATETTLRKRPDRPSKASLNLNTAAQDTVFANKAAETSRGTATTAGNIALAFALTRSKF